MHVVSMFNLATSCILLPNKILVYSATFEPDDSISVFLHGFFKHFLLSFISVKNELNLSTSHGNTSPALPKTGLVPTNQHNSNEETVQLQHSIKG